MIRSPLIFALYLVFALVVVVGCASKKSPAFVARFSTPQETFETWVHSARTADLSLMALTHAPAARSAIEEEFRNYTPEQLEAMGREARKTEFKVEQIVYEGGRAFLRITRKLGKGAETEVITMIREGQEWRILP
jgi:hypothetical protein